MFVLSILVILTSVLGLFTGRALGSMLIKCGVDVEVWKERAIQYEQDTSSWIEDTRSNALMGYFTTLLLAGLTAPILLGLTAEFLQEVVGMKMEENWGFFRFATIFLLAGMFGHGKAIQTKI